jgi:transposase-like protein
MTEISAELVSRLVTGRKRDGRCSYDAQAKSEVVRACLQPGVSVARMAMQCGVNANLLRRWIAQCQGLASAPKLEAAKRQDAIAAFVPLRIEASKEHPEAVQPVMVRLHVRLPNGVEFDLSQASPSELSPVLRILGAMPCSSSTNR